jgi:hypothetical protein
MALKWWHGLTHNERFVFRAGAILGAAGFVFGYDIGVVTGGDARLCLCGCIVNVRELL